LGYNAIKNWGGGPAGVRNVRSAKQPHPILIEVISSGLGGVMIKLLQRRNLVSGLMLATGIIGLGVGQAILQHRAEAQGASVQAPMFEVDPLWPKPLPNNWLLGWTIGTWVDERDNIWVIHRGAGGLHNNERGAELNPPIAECCRTAPPILVYDLDGNLVRTWGGPGPGYE